MDNTFIVLSYNGIEHKWYIGGVIYETIATKWFIENEEFEQTKN